MCEQQSNIPTHYNLGLDIELNEIHISLPDVLHMNWLQKIVDDNQNIHN